MPYNSTLATGVTADGEQATTLQWGTTDAMRSSVDTVGSYYVVLDMQAEQNVAFREDLPNGDGLTSTRVIGVNGVRWTITVREDSRFTAPIIGQQVYLADWTGWVGSRGTRYRGRVVEGSSTIGIKQAGTRHVTVERFTLIDT